VQEEHLTVGRRCDMRSVGALGASWAMIDNKKECGGWNVEGNRKDAREAKRVDVQRDWRGEECSLQLVTMQLRYPVMR
jgi:hypothetical protein